jgi:hypothetical protein
MKLEKMNIKFETFKKRYLTLIASFVLLLGTVLIGITKHYTRRLVDDHKSSSNRLNSIDNNGFYNF